MIPVSTRDSEKRGALASFTNIAGLAVMGAGSMVFPILAGNLLGNDQSMWLLVMAAVAVFTALTAYLQFKFTRERVTEEDLGSGASAAAQPKTASIGQQLHAVTSEKWWWIIIIFYLLFQWSGAIKNGSMTQFCEWVVDSSGMPGGWGAVQSLLSLLGAVPMADRKSVV